MQGAGKSAVKRPTADLPEQGEERPSSSLRPSGRRLPLWPKQQDHEHMATQAEERIKLLQSLATMQLGEVREGRRLPGADTRSVSFHRFPLSPTLRAMLQQLDVPESLWPVPPSSCPTAPRDRLLPSMEGAGKRGRCAAAEENPFVAENGFENKVAFLLHERQWAAALVPDVCLNIRSQWYSYKPGFKVLLWCNSCVQYQERGGWKGYSTYNLTTKKVEREYTPLDKHGDPTAKKRWTPLTSTSENALQQFVAIHAQ